MIQNIGYRISSGVTTGVIGGGMSIVLLMSILKNVPAEYIPYLFGGTALFGFIVGFSKDEIQENTAYTAKQPKENNQ